MAGIAAIISAFLLGSPSLAKSFVTVTDQIDRRSSRKRRLLAHDWHEDEEVRPHLNAAKDPPEKDVPLAG
ncbi:hypothetical protein C7S10_08110 [Nocardioides currus]|uniref:Uncharacterized protein n=1 Tax=Nocardioides currus TaxID=2133958 RepID=A0A2R7Z047_9ACTN|nr:hypothetical protein C7S10_08110 [Nocardioides currus]